MTSASERFGKAAISAARRRRRANRGLVLPAMDRLLRHYVPVDRGDGLLHDVEALSHGILGSTAGLDTNDPTFTSNRTLSYGGDDYATVAEAPVSLASDFEVMAAVRVKDGSDQFDLTAPTVTNLTDEYYVNVEAGDALSAEMPSNHDKNEWLFGGWIKVPFASDDGVRHVFYEVQYDADNFIRLEKDALNDVTLTTRAGGTEKSASLTPGTAWAAGDEIFIGHLFDGTDATLRFDDDGDLTLDTATISSVGTFAAGTYTIRLGMDFAGANPADAGINLVVMDVASAEDPLTDRWGAGGGMDWEDWLQEYHTVSGRQYGEHLVAYFVYSSDGSEVKIKNYAGLPTVSGLRNDTATYVDADGVVQTATANQLRHSHYESSERMTLLEGAYTNLVTNDNFDTGWGSGGTPTVTPGVADPAGGTGAYTIEDASAGSTSYKSATVPFTGDGTKSVVFVVKEATMASSGNQALRLRDETASTFPIDAQVTAWVGGKPSVTMSTGVLLGVAYVGGGFWAVVCQGTVVAANTNRVRIQPCLAPTTTTGSITIWRVNAYDADFPPRSILDASETKAADVFQKDIPAAWVPNVEQTIYVKISNFMLANTGSSTYVFEIGDTASAGSGMRLFAKSGSDGWSVVSRTTTDGTVQTSVDSPNAPAIGSDYEFRIVVGAPVAGTTTITWYVTKDGGTESAGQTHVMGTADAAWNLAKLSLGCSGAGTNQGNVGMKAVKRFLGSKSLAECRSEDGLEGSYYPGMFDELDEPAWTVATKATPSRVIWSESENGAGGPYAYMALTAAEKPEVGVRNSAGTRYEAGGDSTAAVGWHTVGMQLDGTTLKAILDGSIESTTETVSGGLSGVDVSTIGAIRLGVVGHFFDYEIGDVMVYNGILTDEERAVLLNNLRHLYPDLP